MRILMLDDDPVFSEFTCSVISKLGHSIEAVKTNVEVMTKIANVNYDLLLLDVILSDKSGSNGISHAIKEKFYEIFPYIVIISGYDEFSLDAYRIHPYDYLLKPIFERDLIRIVNEIEAQMDINKQNQKVEEEYLIVKEKSEVHRILINDILYVEKINKYLKFNLINGVVEINGSINDILEKLPEAFLQIHRSYIANMNKVNKIADLGNRTYKVCFDESDKEAYMSRKYACRLFELMEL